MMSEEIDEINRRSMEKLRRDKLIGWQPIETAPKNIGILVVGKRGVVWKGFINQRSRKDLPKLTVYGPTGRNTAFKATHWQPLPAPPELS